MMGTGSTHFLGISHEIEEKGKREFAVTVFGKFIENSFQLGPGLQGFDEASKSSEIQGPFMLLVSSSEPLPQLIAGRVEVQSVTHLLDVVEVQLLILLLVGRLPILLLPDRLTHFKTTQPILQPLANRVKLPESDIQHLMLLYVRRDEMKRLVTCTNDVDDGQPPSFGLVAKTELFSVVAGIGPRAEFFDIFYLN